MSSGIQYTVIDISIIGWMLDDHDSAYASKTTKSRPRLFGEGTERKRKNKSSRVSTGEQLINICEKDER